MKAIINLRDGSSPDVVTNIESILIHTTEGIDIRLENCLGSFQWLDNVEYIEVEQ